MQISEARTRPLKELAREIFLDTLAEVDVGRAFERKLELRGSLLAFGTDSVDLAAFERLWVVSLGKAAWATLDGLLKALGPEHLPSRGVVVSNVATQHAPAGFLAFQGGHPVPNAGSLAAAEAILQLAREADEKTLLFFLISGGGSALAEKALAAGGTLDDLQTLNRVLVGCGASIDEINAVRKHLSAFKGGRLAEAAARAHKVTFLLSDVPEGKLATIASGPTLPDPTTVETCYEVVRRYQLLPQFPASIRALFEKQQLHETPKAGAAAFARAQTFLLLSSHDVIHAAHRAAGARGFHAECDMTPDDWELPRAAAYLLARLEAMRASADRNPDKSGQVVCATEPGQNTEMVGQAFLPAGSPFCLISGGEILCPVTGDGRGGRNQAFVLHCVEKIAGREMAVLSAGTDGIDGNSPAAGAVADGETLARSRAGMLDPEDFFRRSDSFRFFDALGDAVVTGPQQNNLRDLRLFLSR
ncbi:MAG: glycerate kinase type-2 family protein [Candidatus Acidiferrales bacterium]